MNIHIPININTYMMGLHILFRLTFYQEHRRSSESNLKSLRREMLGKEFLQKALLQMRGRKYGAYD